MKRAIADAGRMPNKRPGVSLDWPEKGDRANSWMSWADSLCTGRPARVATPHFSKAARMTAMPVAAAPVEHNAPIVPSGMETTEGVRDTWHLYRIVPPGRQEGWPGGTIHTFQVALSIHLSRLKPVCLATAWITVRKSM